MFVSLFLRHGVCARTAYTLAAAVWFASPSSLAQTNAPRVSKPAEVAAPAPIEVSERHTFDGLALSVALPQDASAIEDGMMGDSVGSVRDAKGTWEVTIQRRKSSDTNLKLKDVADKALTQLLARFGTTIEKDGKLKSQPTWKPAPDTEVVNGKVVSVATLLLREPVEGKQFVIRNGGKNLNAERFYVYMPAFDDRKAVVRGVTFVEVAPGEFLVFDMATSATAPQSPAEPANDGSPAKTAVEPINLDAVTSARAPYEMIVASAELVDQSGNETQRAASVQAASRVLNSLTLEQLKQLVEENKERWERVYRPAPDGKKDNDIEVAYRRITMKFGPRRDMPGINVRGVEGAAQGFLVRIDARVLEGESVIDSQSVFFMTPDRNEESWSVRMTVRDGVADITHTEVGARVGTDMKVTITSNDGKNERIIRPQVATEGFVSRVDSYLLPMIYVRSGIPTIYGTYAYQSQTERVQYRRDVLEQPSEAGKPFTLRTKLSDDQPTEQVSLYDAKGVLIRSELATGVLSEPSSLAEIKAIWTKKGLPVN